MASCLFSLVLEAVLEYRKMCPVILGIVVSCGFWMFNQFKNKHAGKQGNLPHFLGLTTQKMCETTTQWCISMYFPTVNEELWRFSSIGSYMKQPYLRSFLQDIPSKKPVHLTLLVWRRAKNNRLPNPSGKRSYRLADPQNFPRVKVERDMYFFHSFNFQEVSTTASCIISYTPWK